MQNMQMGYSPPGAPPQAGGITLDWYVEQEQYTGQTGFFDRIGPEADYTVGVGPAGAEEYLFTITRMDLEDTVENILRRYVIEMNPNRISSAEDEDNRALFLSVRDKLATRDGRLRPPLTSGREQDGLVYAMCPIVGGQAPTQRTLAGYTNVRTMPITNLRAPIKNYFLHVVLTNKRSGEQRQMYLCHIEFAEQEKGG